MSHLCKATPGDKRAAADKHVTKTETSGDRTRARKRLRLADDANGKVAPGWDTEYPLPGLHIKAGSRCCWCVHCLEIEEQNWTFRSTKEAKKNEGSSSPRLNPPGFPSNKRLPSNTNTFPIPAPRWLTAVQGNSRQCHNTCDTNLTDNIYQVTINSLMFISISVQTDKMFPTGGNR